MTGLMGQDNGKDGLKIVTVNVGDILYIGIMDGKVV